MLAPELAPAKLEGFEVWDARKAAPEHCPEVKAAWVSVLQSGVIGINRTTNYLLGEPDAVQLMFDPARRRIGIKKVAPEAEPNYPIDQDRNSIQIGCRSFMDYYGIRPGESRRITPTFTDDALILDL